MEQEQKYLLKRIWKGRLGSLAFYLCRIFPIRKKKVVFCCIEGTTGYSCNPKYIAKALMRRNKGLAEGGEREFELVWLVNDMSRRFPAGIRAVRNTLWNRAYELSTAHFWIDNSRKQLEVRKRRGQVYIQTWHAKLGFKPTCLDRGRSFSRIAYLVSRHDSAMIDYVLSNSKWYDDTLPSGMMYNGPTLMTGSPRCDILVRAYRDKRYKQRIRSRLMERLGMDRSGVEQRRFVMYAPTFRGGSQETERKITAGEDHPDFKVVTEGLGKRFGGEWSVLLRLHPQLASRGLCRDGAGASPKGDVMDVSRMDDMYEILAGCDAFITDYSSAAFDAAVMRIPVFLYCKDHQEYEAERGRLLWDLDELPFPLARDDKGLYGAITGFDGAEYQTGLERLFESVGMLEDGRAAERVAEFISKETTEKSFFT